MRSLFVLLSFLIGVQGFYILRKHNSKNHQEITRIAILRATKQVCKSMDSQFQEPNPLDVESLASACQKKEHESHFQRGIRVICYYNVMTDLTHSDSPQHHFDNEMFKEGKELITEGINTTIDQMNRNLFDDARKTLGEIMHTLQDFYSHSNWIELGNTEPCTALINQDENIPNPADENTETCEDKPQGIDLKVKEDILRQKILTSGYTRKSNPKGKCSHGGFRDFSSGINKDFSASCHGPLHNKAADVAIAASVQLLEKIWKNIDGPRFLRLVGLDEVRPAGGWQDLLFSLFTSRYPDASESPNEVVEAELTD
ncbi:von Willebrand factor A domain-containing protein 7-like [Carassius auratus]|uniref:von Willebrand factor A domain-containing protein 7-like n=1 Tax=Carassius auratus TaxID=7957 RepID=A0A6P6NPW1_CARAU|nr:von Willebrand factor A domain-containing protein 7-like [Carassius auratus]